MHVFIKYKTTALIFLKCSHLRIILKNKTKMYELKNKKLMHLNKFLS